LPGQDQVDARLVLQLVVPAIGSVDAEDVVRSVLHRPPERGGADDAELQLGASMGAGRVELSVTEA
jgi:hypothetical protein